MIEALEDLGGAQRLAIGEAQGVDHVFEPVDICAWMKLARMAAGYERGGDRRD